MPDETLAGMVPARYQGHDAQTYRMDLSLRRLRLGDGTPVPAQHVLIPGGSWAMTTLMEPGQVYLYPEQEVLGATHKRTPDGQYQFLGVGRVILPQDAEVAEDGAALAQRGYLFSEGRADLEAVDRSDRPAPEAASPKRAKKSASDVPPVSSDATPASEETPPQEGAAE